VKSVNMIGQHRSSARCVGWVSAICLLAAVCGAAVQAQTKIPRIGFLGAASPAALAFRVEAFRQGLRELGYVEGKNVIIEWRWAEGKFERLPELAADLVRVGVDVIVTGGPQATRPARDATSTVPIVMGFDNDPVGAGFIVSLARPGRNITGLSSQAPEITGKQLELLREIVPRLSRVAVLGNSAEPFNAAALVQSAPTGRRRGMISQKSSSCSPIMWGA